MGEVRVWGGWSGMDCGKVAVCAPGAEDSGAEGPVERQDPGGGGGVGGPLGRGAGQREGLRLGAPAFISSLPSPGGRASASAHPQA